MAKKRIIGIIPFFGGLTSDKDTTDRNVGWLSLTHTSMLKYCSDILIYVCRKADENLAKTVTDISNIRVVECEPLFLPATACRHTQEIVKNYDLVLYTEADHIFHINDIDFLTTTIENNMSAYIAPHRCVRLSGTEVFGEWERFGHHVSGTSRYLFLRERFLYNDAEYIVDNKPHALIWNDEVFAQVHDNKLYQYGFFMNSAVFNDVFYVNTIDGCAYGAAYLCHASLFSRVNFIDAEQFPLEHASGFDIFNMPDSIALKTLNNQMFWVDHLSHRTGNTSTWA